MWQKAIKSRLAQDTLRMLGLQGVNKAIAFAAMSYVMQKLGPAELGTAALVLAASSQIAVVADFGLDIAGVRTLSGQSNRWSQTIGLIFGIRLRSGLLLAMITLVGVLIVNPENELGLWILAPVLLFFSVMNPQWIFQGIGKVPVLNVIQLGQSILCALLYIWLFIPSPTATTYLLISAIGTLSAWGAAFIVLRRKIMIPLPQPFDSSAAWKLLWNSRHAYLKVLVVATYGGLQIPLLSIFLSASDAGIYRSAQSLISVTAPLLAVAPLLVYPRLVAWREKSLVEFERNLKMIMSICAVISLGIVFTSIGIVIVYYSLVLGPQFKPGIVPSITLFGATALILINSIPSWGLHACGLDKTYLKVIVVSASMAILLDFLFIPLMGVLGASLVNVIFETSILLLSTHALFSYLHAQAPKTRT